MIQKRSEIKIKGHNTSGKLVMDFWWPDWDKYSTEIYKIANIQKFFVFFFFSMKMTILHSSNLKQLICYKGTHEVEQMYQSCQFFLIF